MDEELLGEPIARISHYFAKAGVAVMVIEKGILKVNDKIRIKGHTTDFEMTVQSMQIEHKQIQEAKQGDDIGMKVPEPVREHDQVYKV